MKTFRLIKKKKKTGEVHLIDQYVGTSKNELPDTMHHQDYFS